MGVCRRLTQSMLESTFGQMKRAARSRPEPPPTAHSRFQWLALNILHWASTRKEGTMAVLISHRFSTVRMADRILVLKNGELVEQGTHEALVSLGGLYSELFQLQAAGYR